MQAINLSSKSGKRKVWYFVLVFFIIPTVSVSGLSSVIGRFFPNPLGYNLLAFLLSLPLLHGYNRKYGSLSGVIWAIGVLVLYVVATFLRTMGETSFWATLTVFRYSFMQVLNLFVLLPFMFSLKKKEVNYALHCIFKCLIVFTLLYLSNNLIYDWMGVKGESLESHGGISIDRSIIGMPLFDPFWSALLVVYTILNVPNAWKYLLVLLFTLILSFTRSLLFSTIIVIVVVLLIAVCKNVSYLKRGLKFMLLVLCGMAVMELIMPESIDFWLAKLTTTFGEDLKYDMGTFAFRERLIEDALFEIRNDPLFGLGYIRDADKGEYSLVMGSDTYIAPVLYCEGWIGMVLRVLPFLILTLSSLKNICKESRINWADWMVVACVIASSVNYVQTKALTDYPLILGLLILIKIKDNYDRKTKDFGNYSIL